MDAALRDAARPKAFWWLRVRPSQPLSFFEFWPGWLFYAPVVLQWLALGVRYGSPLLPTAANPHIEAGGLCGESKTSILDQVEGEARDWIAPYTAVVTGADPARDLPEAEAALARAGLSYPLVGKPDIGCNGTGVRMIEDRAGLARFLADYPRGVTVIFQQFVPYEGEAGIFYVRLPGESAGRITSLTLKSAPMVIGDGRSTLKELILKDPRAGLVPHLYLTRLKGRLTEVPATGEAVRLVFVGNHCKGSTFRNGAGEITAALTQVVDSIAGAIPEFHFGRIDVRFASLAELRRGRSFRIIEINGAGSEATHIWDPSTRLIDAYAAQFFHYHAAFVIGRANRARGHRPLGIREALRLWRQQKRLMASYPMND
ncbi:MAG TPA: D-alanine--D-alanine ligase [Acetobacteraceae bacterium]|nr:D-alanine--D-alanine ligase [Acetobacteraceae bacterium]